MNTRVFLGPSLDLASAKQIFGNAEYRPPARKGDIYRCLAENIDTIALIDGVFHGEPSVWPREIVDAMNDGISVYGSSSMGALRALELAPFGMTGFGTVFDWYRSGAIEGDDEVALVYVEHPSGYQPLSEPLVNIRATLAEAVKNQQITEQQSMALVAHARQTYYPHRSLRALLDCPAIEAWSKSSVETLHHLVSKPAINPKQEDARALLQFLAQRPFAPKRPSLGLPLRSDRFEARSFPTPSGLRSGSELMDLLHHSPRFSSLRQELHRRWFLISWARENQISPPKDELRRSLASRGLDPDSQMADRRWLADRGLSLVEALHWQEEVALAEWLRRRGSEVFGLPSQPDMDAPFIESWASIFGISPRDGRPLSAWLIDEGPRRFGFSDMLPERLLIEAQMTSRVM